MSKEIAPLIEQGLEEGVNVQLPPGLVPACPARVMTPVRAVTVAHVLGDVGAESDAKRLQPFLDPLLGRKRFLGHAGAHIHADASRSTKRASTSTSTARVRHSGTGCAERRWW